MVNAQTVVRMTTLAALLMGMLALATHYAVQGEATGEPGPDMSVVQNHSPVQLGDDEGRLEASNSTPDSVLVACKRDPGQPRVYSKGRRGVGTHIYSVSDGTVGDGCERNNTDHRLWQHWLEQGNLQSQVSNHR